MSRAFQRTAVLKDAMPKDAMPKDVVAVLRPWLTYPVWGILLALLVVYPLAPGWFTRFQFVPFAVGLLLFGLPHGAMDQFPIPRLTGRPMTWRYLVSFVSIYLVLTLLLLALWSARPEAVLFCFLLISWVHWGQGDAYFLRAFLGRPPCRSAAGLALVWALRGALPILLPLLAFPAVFQAVSAGILAPFHFGSQGWVIPNTVRSVGLAGIGLLAAAYVADSWRDNGRRATRAFWTDIGEAALLLALFSRVTPIFAVGLYFCLWHSPRHIARLMLIDPATCSLLEQNRVAAAARRTFWQSLPLTIAALALLFALAALHLHRHAPLSALIYLYLALIAALTVPHFLLVLWMDRRQGCLQTGLSSEFLSS